MQPVRWLIDRRMVLKAFELLFPLVSTDQIHRLLNNRLLRLVCSNVRNSKSLLRSQTLHLLNFLVSVLSLP